jgi:hypothetical protein
LEGKEGDTTAGLGYGIKVGKGAVVRMKTIYVEATGWDPGVL